MQVEDTDLLASHISGYTHSSQKKAVVYESVEEQTEALEYSGRHHQARCLFEIVYEDRNPPSVLSLSLKVPK
jgi:hypothetical protein